MAKSGIRSALAAVALSLSLPALAGSSLQPSGGDDTEVLQAALDRCARGKPTCAVRLGAGTFHTSQLFASGFHGVIMGAGTDRTVIEALPELKVSDENGAANGYNPGGVFATPPGVNNPYPYLISLVGSSDVVAADFTVSVPHSPATTLWYYGQDGASNFLKTVFYVQGNGRFHRMAFQGGAQFNLDNALMLEAGDVLELKSSRVNAMCSNGLEVWGAVGTRITIGGSPEDGNVFEGGAGAGLFGAVDGVTVEHSWNRTTGTGCGWYGVLVQNAPVWGPLPQNPSRFVIANDQFAAVDGAVPIFLNDGWVNPTNGGVKTIDADVVNNTIDARGGPGSAAVWVRFLSGGLFAANRISGDGCVGMYLGRSAYTSALANDLGRFVATADDFCFGADGPSPSILLYQGSHDSLVAGNRTPQGVVDWGTNNTVILNR